MKKRQIPLFYQYLISYILVLITPIMISGIIIHSSILGFVKEQELKNADALEQISGLVDTKFTEFISIAIQLSSIPGLSLDKTRDPIGILNVRSVLNYSVGNKAIQELSIFFHGADYLFSAETTYRPFMFYDAYFRNQWTYEQFIEEVGRLKSPLLLPSSDSGRALIKYLIPLPYYKTKPFGTAIFLIKEESLKDLFRPVAVYKKSNSLVFDDSGRLILSLRDDPDLDTEIIKQLSSVSEQGSELIRLADTEYLLSYVKSAMTGWTYTTLVPKPELMAPVNRMIYVE